MNMIQKGTAMEPYRGNYFEDFVHGRTFLTPLRTVTESDIVRFAGLSGDFNPLHMDESFAKETPHGTRIAHGMLTASIASGLAAQAGLFDGTALALMAVQMKFTAAVYPGDTVQLALTVTGTKKTPDGTSGIVQLKTHMENQKKEVVSDGKWTLLVKTRAYHDTDRGSV